jgi:phosphoribosyl-AMP cyclohydrolase
VSASIEIEEGLGFMPKFDANGLITAISQDAITGDVLMVAYMNEEALNLTLKTGNAVFFSRSRGIC